MADVKLEAAFDAFCEWCAMWPAVRERMGLPNTQKDFAPLVGVSEQTLTAWKKRPEFKERVTEYSDALIDSARPQVLGAMVETASMTGRDGHQDRKLYLQHRGELVDRKELRGRVDSRVDVDVTVRSVRSMTEKELSKLMFHELQQQFPGKPPAEIAGIQKALLRTAERSGMPEPEVEGTYVPLAREDEIDVPWEEWVSEEGESSTRRPNETGRIPAD